MNHSTEKIIVEQGAPNTLSVFVFQLVARGQPGQRKGRGLDVGQGMSPQGNRKLVCYFDCLNTVNAGQVGRELRRTLRIALKTR